MSEDLLAANPPAEQPAAPQPAAEPPAPAPATEPPAPAPATEPLAAAPAPASGPAAPATPEPWWRGEGAFYVLVAVLALAAVTAALHLWRADIRIPFDFDGDALLSAATLKGLLDHGSAWVNNSLGAPGAMNLLDFPGADGLHFAVLWVLGRIAGWAVALNVYYIAGYVLVALSAAWSLRRLGATRPAAVLASVLYAVVPGHMLHGLSHIYLSSYFLVPPVLAFAIELSGTTPPLVAEKDGRERLALFSRASILPLVIFAAAGAAGIYYAWFGVVFTLVGTARGWWVAKSRARLYAGVTLLLVMVLVAGLSLAPFIAYRRSAGLNTEVAKRDLAETELYGLKLTYLLLPVTGHRSPRFSALTDKYTAHIVGVLGSDFRNESQDAALGLSLAFGVLVLIWVMIRGRAGPERPVYSKLPVEAAASLGMAGILLGVAGGFGTIIALYYDEFRAYNRIAFFLGFLAAIGFAYAFEYVRASDPKSWKPYVTWGVVAALLFLGVVDQTTKAMVPNYKQNKADWTSTSAFVAKVESNLPSGAMVLQLPYVPFPENPPVVKMIDYDHFRPYLLSSKIHWSYGAVKGRKDAEWLSATATETPDVIVKSARDKKFAGIWVDRFGYGDNGVDEVRRLGDAAGVKPMTSDDGRYSYFALKR